MLLKLNQSSPSNKLLASNFAEMAWPWQPLLPTNRKQKPFRCFLAFVGTCLQVLVFLGKLGKTVGKLLRKLVCSHDHCQSYIANQLNFQVKEKPKKNPFEASICKGVTRNKMKRKIDLFPQRGSNTETSMCYFPNLQSKVITVFYV